MITEKSKDFLLNVSKMACGIATCVIFLEYARRGKLLVKRKRLKKNRGYIRLYHLYCRMMRDDNGIKFCVASFNLIRLDAWRRLNIEVNFIPKRFKRRSLPWRLIRRKSK